MCSCYLIIVISVAVFSEPVRSSWEFVVSVKGRINFYTSDWVLVTSAAHQFDKLSAIALDEIEETLYFNDQSHPNGTIFSLKLSPTDNHVIERVVKKTKHEKVERLAFDPLGRTLYWTDVVNGIIYQKHLNDKHKPSVFMKDLKDLHGIAIDVCRRKLYWTSAEDIYNSTIGRTSLDSNKTEIIISGLDLIRGIFVDQFSRRIYFANILQDDLSLIESANLDGTDRRTVVKNKFQAPFDITVDLSYVYWIDTLENGVWKVEKTAYLDKEFVPRAVYYFSQSNTPKGIIHRNYFLTSQANNTDCKSVIDAINNSIYSNTARTSTETTSSLPDVQCLNKGHFDVKTKSCQCIRGFNGPQCEIPNCQNCTAGFSGERCEIDQCSNHCLHGGHCTIEYNEPNCQCSSSFYGIRCENVYIKDICIRYYNKEDVGQDFDMKTICNYYRENGSFLQPSYFHFDLKTIFIYILLCLILTFLFIGYFRILQKLEANTIRP